MPSQLEPALEERYGEMLAQLRAGHVTPSPELAHRVRLLASLEPAPPRRRFRFNPRLALVLAGAALVAAAVAGAVRLAGDKGEPAAERGVTFAAQGRAGGGADTAESAAPQQRALRATGRLKDFRAELAVRVDDADELPQATQRAMQIADAVGGYVVSASYDGGASDSLVVLSVPIARAQDAIRRLSALGELARQKYSLQDLQATVDQLDAQADRLEERIAELQQQLRNRNLTRAERVVIRNRLEQAQRELEGVLGQRDGTVAQGQSAEIAVTLTADRDTAGQGIVGRAVDSLKRVWEWVLAVLIVGLPFAALLALAVVAGRRWRRRANERLLGA